MEAHIPNRRDGTPAINNGGALPPTSASARASRMGRRIWHKRKDASNVRHRHGAHGSAVCPAHRRRCRMHTSGSASGASKTTPSHVFAAPDQIGAADPDGRSGGLHQANGADAERICGSGARLYSCACAFLSLILPQDIKSSGSRWPVSSATSGHGRSGRMPRVVTTRRPAAPSARSRESFALWFAHLRQRGQAPYTPAKSTWGADAHPGAPDVRRRNGGSCCVPRSCASRSQAARGRSARLGGLGADRARTHLPRKGNASVGPYWRRSPLSATFPSRRSCGPSPRGIE